MKHIAWITIVVAVCALSCKKDKTRQPDTTYNPEILSTNFSNSTSITNPYFPLETGKKFIYEGQTENGLERSETHILPTTRNIMGIACVVVSDRVWINGKLAEDTDDWYAQDNSGNVWYMGEYSTEYNTDGSVKDHEGSWEAGVDGAKPGIQMLAEPKVGMAYRQEYDFDNAEDEAKVLEIGKIVNIAFGSFTNCVKIEEWTDLEPGSTSYKIYAPNIGLIQDGDDIFLVEIQQ